MFSRSLSFMNFGLLFNTKITFQCTKIVKITTSINVSEPSCYQKLKFWVFITYFITHFYYLLVILKKRTIVKTTSYRTTQPTLIFFSPYSPFSVYLGWSLISLLNSLSFLFVICYINKQVKLRLCAYDRQLNMSRVR